jgi:hypothetical protein
VARLAKAASAVLGLLFLGYATAQAADKITLMHSVPQLTSLFAFGSSIPIELGFWKDEGLEVEGFRPRGRRQPSSLWSVAVPPPPSPIRAAK